MNYLPLEDIKSFLFLYLMPTLICPFHSLPLKVQCLPHSMITRAKHKNNENVSSMNWVFSTEAWILQLGTCGRITGIIMISDLLHICKPAEVKDKEYGHALYSTDHWVHQANLQWEGEHLQVLLMFGLGSVFHIINTLFSKPASIVFMPWWRKSAIAYAKGTQAYTY